MIGAQGLQGKSWPDLDMLPLGFLTDPGNNSGQTLFWAIFAAIIGRREKNTLGKTKGKKASKCLATLRELVDGRFILAFQKRPFIVFFLLWINQLSPL